MEGVSGVGPGALEIRPSIAGRCSLQKPLVQNSTGGASEEEAETLQWVPGSSIVDRYSSRMSRAKEEAVEAGMSRVVAAEEVEMYPLAVGRYLRSAA